MEGVATALESAAAEYTNAAVAIRSATAATGYVELPLLIDCAGETLAGVVSQPQPVAATAVALDIGVVILVGGPQYRIGSHRQFVLLARHLASRGYAVLRFDRSGMGDASGMPVPFDQAQAEISAAVAALRRAAPQVQRVVLWGLCDGASAGLLYWQQTRDPVIAGLAIVNPWVRSVATQARTRVKHYYLKRLGQKEFWRKLFAGNVAGLQAARELAGNVASSVTLDHGGDNAASWRDAMAEALDQYPGDLLLILSGQDYTAREFLEWMQSVVRLRRFGTRAGLTRRDVPKADHTFSAAVWRAEVERATLAWLDGIGARA